MTAETKIEAEAPPKLKGVHHSAFRCRDAEETRAFYEDVLGLPVRAALAFDQVPGSGEENPYMHLFFELGDGNYIAFFDVPRGASEDRFALKDGMDLHFAMEAESHDEMMRFRKRLKAAGVPVFGPIDHHFCHSIYFHDPNGLALEITCRDAAHDRIMAEEAARARDVIAAWSARTAEAKAANRG
ncbi:MAG: VOC family protein [Pseudomonadota bacterium]